MRRPGWVGGWGQNGPMCMRGRVPPLFTWNCHDFVNWLYPVQNKKVTTKKDDTSEAQAWELHLNKSGDPVKWPWRGLGVRSEGPWGDSSHPIKILQVRVTWSRVSPTPTLGLELHCCFQGMLPKSEGLGAILGIALHSHLCPDLPSSPPAPGQVFQPRPPSKAQLQS